MAAAEPYPGEGDVLRTVYLSEKEDNALKRLAHRQHTTPQRIIRQAAERIPAMCANGEL